MNRRAVRLIAFWFLFCGNRDGAFPFSLVGSREFVVGLWMNGGLEGLDSWGSMRITALEVGKATRIKLGQLFQVGANFGTK